MGTCCAEHGTSTCSDTEQKRPCMGYALYFHFLIACLDRCKVQLLTPCWSNDTTVCYHLAVSYHSRASLAHRLLLRRERQQQPRLRFCSTSNVAPHVQAPPETVEPPSPKTYEELLENTKTTSPRLYEILKMDDATLASEVAAGLDAKAFRQCEAEYLQLLKDLNASEQYLYVH